MRENGAGDEALDQFTVEDQIDQICDSFEEEWLAGGRPEINRFLAEADESQRQQLAVELLKVDVEYRRRQGETPHPGDYQTGIDITLFEPAFWEIFGATLPDEESAQEQIQRMGRFDLLAQAGSGGFGTVWRAKDRMLDRVVALKIPLMNRVGTSERHSFLREARAGAQLHHPNIVRVYEVGQHEQTPFIVSEFIEGTSLQKRLAQGPLPIREAVELCIRLADALQHAHDQGIIHRDLKPANILLDENGSPRIADFGLSKRLSAETTTTAPGQILGTAMYMSPEQAMGESHLVTPRSDQYSLGVLLYECLCGVVPFKGEIQSVLHQILTATPTAPRKINPAISRELQAIVLKAVEKDPSRRYASMREFAADLECFLHGRRTKARPIGPLRQGWRWLVRSRVRVAVAAALVVTSSLAMRSLLWSAPMDGNRQYVTITTEPQGASIACVPLDPFSGEPIPEKMEHAPSATPTRMWLKPGHYLVVAYFDDRRFNEVYRFVPTDEEIDSVRSGRSLMWGHIRFYHLPGRLGKEYVEEGTELGFPPIPIPDAGVSSDMALVGKSTLGTNRVALKDGHRTRRLIVPDFYCDPYEFTVEDYRRVVGTPTLSSPTIEWLDAANLADSPRAPMRASWSVAIVAAERAGKRLPTRAEYQLMATAGGKTRFPWGDDLPAEAGGVTEWSVAGEPAFDELKLPGQPSIFGLCSNVAEWTGAMRRDPHAGEGELRPIVCGGNGDVVNGSPAVTEEMRNPEECVYVPYAARDITGLGFRLVRSAKPRVTPVDFEHEVN